MKLIWTYLKKYPKWLILDVVGALTFVLVNLGLPTALARMIDQGVTPGNKERVYFWAIVMFAIIVIGTVGRVVLAYAAGKITTNMIKDMRNDMYDKLQQYSHIFSGSSNIDLSLSFIRHPSSSIIFVPNSTHFLL